MKGWAFVRAIAVALALAGCREERSAEPAPAPSDPPPSLMPPSAASPAVEPSAPEAPSVPVRLHDPCLPADAVLSVIFRRTGIRAPYEFSAVFCETVIPDDNFYFVRNLLPVFTRKEISYRSFTDFKR